ncbi:MULTISPECIES: EAL domain-containing protein [Bacillota]|uniref:EAL domain-containing protein n=2 Tax=Amedibacillus TaxID=2749846 RepID=A0A7G9GLC0_9FIRM|nr:MULTISPECIES: EAL domain-containing protein [Bacillota]QNM11602.1 EAL domain-containing protein [[Eubacterium] hominis]MCH4285152.1 GGDEF domain-containing protein [Amedibacillus hominis]RGB56180.1 GGDEF domain-containing protein [Absiella sp. AM22-9]RGB61941.1 GGDEF domain-containing protein [Absiella sp. AM10-20]RGB70237.1 GGDEF domain-containing protein [Absiella sp. AM09-45]
MNNNQKQFAFKKQIWTFIGALVIVICITMGLSYTYLKNTNHEIFMDATKHLQDMNQRVVELLDLQMENDLDVLAHVAQTYQIDQMNEKILSSVQQNDFIMVTAVNDEGKFYTDFHQKISTKELFDTLKKDKQPHIYNNTFTVDEGLVYVYPMMDKKGEVNGAIIAITDFSKGTAKLCESYNNEDMFLHVMERDGTFVIKSKQEGVIINSNNMYYSLNEQTELEESDITDLKKALSDNQSVVVEIKFKNNVEKLASYTPMKLGNLYAVLVIDRTAAISDTFHTIFDESLRNTIIIFILMLIIWSALFYNYYTNNHRLFNIAYMDPVTKGYNTTRFYNEAEIKIKAHPSNYYSMIIIDIQHFKYINETFGTSRGNKMLKHVYKNIEQQLLPDELMCRSFADKFLLLVKTQSDQEILNKMDQISHSINAFNEGLEEKYYLVLSAGVYIIDNPQMSIYLIQDRANTARRNEKGAKGTFLYKCMFFSDLERIRMHREKDLENRMEESLANHEFEVFIQPKANLKESRIDGGEALVRWRAKDGSLIPPNEFIPVFEKDGFIIKLDLYVFEKVCQYLRNWMDTGITPVPISVNLSRVHLNDADFIRPYQELQEKYKIPTGLLEIELTESMFTENMKIVTDAVNKIHDAGFMCSLDDFGSGYSSLNMLIDVNVDTIKLDKAFFRSDNLDDPKEKTVISSVIDMANKLKLSTVSEGIETIEQFKILQKMNCDIIQGYVVSKPIPEEQFKELLKHPQIHISDEESYGKE